MEPPTKRQRIDENLDLASVTDNTDLDQVPSFTDLRLKFKSRLEAIFDKYDRDFTGVGDEVDIQTGEVVVDNGHLAQLPDEDNVIELGSDEEWASDSSDDDLLGFYQGYLWTTPRQAQPIGPTATSSYETPSNSEESPVNDGRHQTASTQYINGDVSIFSSRPLI